MDELNDNQGVETFYADALGKVDPVAVENFEEGKVELSIPRKYIPRPKEPKLKSEPKPALLPRGKAVPVFSSQTYVDDEGIEHMIPPTYDKSKMNLPKAKFQRPNDMPEFVDDEGQLLSDKEVPSFLQNWKDENKVSEIDNEVNQILDDDSPIDFAQETGESYSIDNVSLEGKQIERNDLSEISDEVGIMQLNENTSANNDFSLMPKVQGISSDMPNYDEDDGEIDIENLDAIIAAHSPVQEEVKVEELGADEVMSGDLQGRGDEAERTPIPSLNDNDIDNIIHTDEKNENNFKYEAEGELSFDSLMSQEEISEPKIDDVSAPTEVNMGFSDEDKTSNQKSENIEIEIQGNVSGKEKNGLLGENKFAQEYSLGLAENYKVISVQDFPVSFVGDDHVNALQINAGESDYGWSVEFDNGIVMGISDVRRYQLQFGTLPSAHGVMMYGTKKMTFSNVKKIVLYQIPKYFRYTL